MLYGSTMIVMDSRGNYIRWKPLAANNGITSQQSLSQSSNSLERGKLSEPIPNRCSF